MNMQDRLPKYGSFFNARLIRLVTVSILTVLAFVFFHSETGLLELDGKNHDTHDYCEIVKTATPKVAKEVTTHIIKLEADKSICVYFIDELKEQIKVFASTHTDQHFIPNKSNHIYLFDRIFLI